MNGGGGSEYVGLIWVHYDALGNGGHTLDLIRTL